MNEHIRTTWDRWIKMKIREGYTWDDIKHLCVASDKSESLFVKIQAENGLSPHAARFSDWLSYVEQKRLADLASMLVAVFDQNAENRQRFRNWFLHYAMERSAELERIWFYEDALEKVERYAMGIHVAFISLDDPDGSAIGQRLYDCNSECMICYYASHPWDITSMLHSRPYETFFWKDGEKDFADKLDDMLCRAAASKNMFHYETKKAFYCYPVQNILFLQSDLKYVHIKTVLGNDAALYAKLSDLEAALVQQHLFGQFIRIHKSFIVNRRHVQQISKQDHMIELTNGCRLPVSDACYKNTLLLLGRTKGILPF